MTRSRRRARRQAEEAREARENAEKALVATRARWPEIRDVAGSLRMLRLRDHFAEQIELLIRGGL